MADMPGLAAQLLVKVLVLLVIQRLAATLEVKVLPVVPLDLVAVQEMVLGAVEEEDLVVVAVAVAVLQGLEVQAHQEVRDLVAAVAVVIVDMVVVVVAALVDLLPVLGMMVAVVVAARATMVVMHHQDPVVAVAAPEVALILFITADPADTGGYHSVASQLRILFMIQTA
jgi:hypothetical protein